MPVSLLASAVALIFAALGGGTLYDHVLPGNLGTFGRYELVGMPLALAISGAALILLAFGPGSSGSALTARRPLFSPGLCFGAIWVLGALSLVRSAVPHSTLSMLAILAGALALGLTARHATGSGDWAVVLISAVTLAASIISCLGIYEYRTEQLGGNSLWRVFVNFSNPDFLAGYLVLTIPVAIALFLSAQERAARILAALAVLLQVVCLVLTGSRLGLLALLCSLVLFGVLAFRGMRLAAPMRRAALVLGALVVLALVASGRPLLRRFLSSGGEAYSAQFRVHTWRGTLRMADANPILGTGLGTFEAAYQRYADIGFTQHAHDGFLQLAGEAGWPAAALTLVGLASTLFLGIRTATGVGVAPPASGPFLPPALVAGLTAGLLGSVIHNVFDSDLYVPATLLTLGAVCGLLLGAARSDSDEPPKPMLWLRWLTAGGGVVLILWSALAAAGRIEADAAEAAAKTGVLTTAVGLYRSATTLDPLNPDYKLSLALLYARDGQFEAARSAYASALPIDAAGKAYRQYGRLLTAMNRHDEALGMYERAAAIEPNSLQNLLALADGYKAVNRPADAEAVYGRMIRMYRGDFGKIRAVPELVEWEYGVAFSGLGEAALAREDFKAAEENYREAAGLLGEFWRQRHLLIAVVRYGSRGDIRTETANLYDGALTGWARSLDSLGDKRQAANVRARQEAFHTERADEAAKDSVGAGS